MLLLWSQETIDCIYDSPRVPCLTTAAPFLRNWDDLIRGFLVSRVYECKENKNAADRFQSTKVGSEHFFREVEALLLGHRSQILCCLKPTALRSQRSHREIQVSNVSHTLFHHTIICYNLWIGNTKNRQELQMKRFGMPGNSTSLPFTPTLGSCKTFVAEWASKCLVVCSSLASCCSFTGTLWLIPCQDQARIHVSLFLGPFYYNLGRFQPWFFGNGSINPSTP